MMVDVVDHVVFPAKSSVAQTLFRGGGAIAVSVMSGGTVLTSITGYDA